MKSILFIRESKGILTGGIEGKILLIAEYLAKNRLLNPILATTDTNSFFSNNFKSLGFPVIGIPMHTIKGMQKAAEHLVRSIKEHDISCIQSHMFRESIIGRKVKTLYPQIKHIFRIHVHIEGSDIPYWRKLAYHFLDYLTARNVDCFVPISNAIEAELRTKSGIPKERIRVVYNGIFPFGEPDCKDVSGNLLSPSIAIVGDLQKRKQQALAIDAIGILHLKNIEINLHLIGQNLDNYLEKIMKAAKNNKVEHLVHYYGYKNQDEIYQIIKNIPVIVLPSLFEGIPTSIIEGMTLRKIVIATPVGGTGELIQDGYNGFLFPPKDSHGLANILEDIFSSPTKKWEEIRDNGYKTWKDNFTAEKMMSGLIDIYRELEII